MSGSCAAESPLRHRRPSVLVLLLTAATSALPAQVTVQDSTGTPVPFAVLESAAGRRVVADAQGVARAARAADGPWLARRIGYRPARGEPGAERIVLARLLDLASPAFLEAHCLVIDDSADDSTAVLRFLHRVGLSGPQINGAYVIDRRSGRLRSDTLDYVQPPRGAPGCARFVSTYASADEEPDPVPIPVRLVEEVEPDDLRVSLDGRRLRIRKTVRRFTRVASP